MEKCIVGDRVQHVDWETRAVKDGMAVEVTPPKKEKPKNYWDYSEEEQKDFATLVKVKWDDGSESEEDMDDLDPEDSEMERDFRKAAHHADDLIQAKLDEASAAINEAVKIAERYGVPFRSHVSTLSNEYFPRSTEKKYPELDREFIQNITDTYNEYESSGWKRSAVC
jgi:hypothetical protein